jgi:hypothetical protein
MKNYFVFSYPTRKACHAKLVSVSTLHCIQTLKQVQGDTFQRYCGYENR